MHANGVSVFSVINRAHEISLALIPAERTAPDCICVCVEQHWRTGLDESFPTLPWGLEDVELKSQ